VTSRSSVGRDVTLFSLGTLVALAAWVYLVRAAIHFGAKARGGEHAAWALMTLAIVGAIACLFIGLMLLSELIRLFAHRRDNTPPPPSGGKRAAR
jgi:hypothetical protein